MQVLFLFFFQYDLEKYSPTQFISLYNKYLK